MHAHRILIASTMHEHRMPVASRSHAHIIAEAKHSVGTLMVEISDSSFFSPSEIPVELGGPGWGGSYFRPLLSINFKSLSNDETIYHVKFVAKKFETPEWKVLKVISVEKRKGKTTIMIC